MELRTKENEEQEEELVVSNLRPFLLKACGMGREGNLEPRRGRVTCHLRVFCRLASTTTWTSQCSTAPCRSAPRYSTRMVSK